MAAKEYKVAEEGTEWASAFLSVPTEAGEVYEFDLSKEQETALVAAGWLTPKKGVKA